MLDFLNVIPPFVSGLMIGLGGVCATFFGVALLWDSFFESAHFPWREWLLFFAFVVIGVIGFLSLL